VVVLADRFVCRSRFEASGPTSPTGDESVTGLGSSPSGASHEGEPTARSRSVGGKAAELVAGSRKPGCGDAPGSIESMEGALNRGSRCPWRGGGESDSGSRRGLTPGWAPGSGATGGVRGHHHLPRTRSKTPRRGSLQSEDVSSGARAPRGERGRWAEAGARRQTRSHPGSNCAGQTVWFGAATGGPTQVGQSTARSASHESGRGRESSGSRVLDN